MIFLYLIAQTSPSWSGPPPDLEASGSHKVRYTTVGRTPVGKWPARHRDLYLTIYKTQTFLLPAGFEPTIPASKRAQTHTLERTVITQTIHSLIFITCQIFFF